MPNKNYNAVAGKPRPVLDKEGNQIMDKKKRLKWELIVYLPKRWGSKSKKPRKTAIFYGTLNQAKKQTAELARQCNNELDRRTVSGEIPAVDSQITFGEYAERWIVMEKNERPRNTWEEYARAIKTHIIPTLGHIYLKDISVYHLKQYMSIKLAGGRLDGKDGGLSRETVKKHIAYISVILEHAADPANGAHIPFNPVRLLNTRISRTSKKQEDINSNNAAIVNCYSASELNYLLGKLEILYSFRRLPKAQKYAVAHELKKLGYTDEEIESPMALFKIKATHLYPIVYVAAHTGMRLSEILALKWSNIDFNQKIIKVYSSLHHAKKRGRRRS